MNKVENIRFAKVNNEIVVSVEYTLDSDIAAQLGELSHPMFGNCRSVADLQAKYGVEPREVHRSELGFKS